MTLGFAWIREVGKTRELLVASDSRLTGGQFWDANPKIVLLPRSDCVISFAGDTHDAYPLMLQVYNAILMHSPARRRVMDLTDLRGHLTRVMNHSRKFITNLPLQRKSAGPSDAIFLLAGYSWKFKDFRIWKLHYDAHIGRFTFRPSGVWRGQKDSGRRTISFVGDPEPIAAARAILAKKLTAKLGGLDMEPFEALRDVIRSNKFNTVGGAPQLVKVYEHMNVVPFAIYWPKLQGGQITFLGRPLMDYEEADGRVIDPDNPSIGATANAPLAPQPGEV